MFSFQNKRYRTFKGKLQILLILIHDIFMALSSHPPDLHFPFALRNRQLHVHALIVFAYCLCNCLYACVLMSFSLLQPLSILCHSFKDIDTYTTGFPRGNGQGLTNIFRAVKHCLPGPVSVRNYCVLLASSKSNDSITSCCERPLYTVPTYKVSK